MHDIRFIRSNPDDFDKALARRRIDPAAKDILAVDEKRRQIQTAMQEKQQKRNALSKDVGKMKSTGGDASALIDEVAELKASLADMEEQDRALGVELDAMLMEYPNILNDDVPDGSDEADNLLIRSVGDPIMPSFAAKDHVALGEGLQMMDCGLGAKL